MENGEPPEFLLERFLGRVDGSEYKVSKLPTLVFVQRDNFSVFALKRSDQFAGYFASSWVDVQVVDSDISGDFRADITFKVVFGEEV